MPDENGLVDSEWALSVARRFVEDMDDRGALGEEPNDEALCYHLIALLDEVRGEEREACAKAIEAERELWINEDKRFALEAAATTVRELRTAKAKVQP